MITNDKNAPNLIIANGQKHICISNFNFGTNFAINLLYCNAENPEKYDSNLNHYNLMNFRAHVNVPQFQNSVLDNIVNIDSIALDFDPEILQNNKLSNQFLKMNNFFNDLLNNDIPK